MLGWAVLVLAQTVISAGGDPTAMKPEHVVYVYQPAASEKSEAYDEAMAAACLQGIINEDGPRLYALSNRSERPKYWLDLFSGEGQWLAGREHVRVDGLDGLLALAGDRVKGVVIWAPEVPASVNVATTIAGVKRGVVLSPELASKCLAKWKLPVLDDLRGRFTGGESGSKKNDAYRWAVREFLAKGLCSSHLFCLFEDACVARASGDLSYVVTRDWAIKNRGFVFDLSPWGDEIPKDDPGQSLGTDLETYKLILDELLRQSAGRHMTEMTGFFSFWKYSNIPGHESKHEPVPTEWETVYLISPYNCYQNTVSSDCYNQSFHSQAPFKKLHQARPKPVAPGNVKAHFCFLMADYDSATPLYDFLPKHWGDPNRGKLPLMWGINPNLIETYPDVIQYVYATATPNDHFASDASAAGYFNPNRVRPEYLDLFVKHNRHFFKATDMTIAPMVLDWDQPTAAVKDAFRKFAPDGFATIVMDLHNTGGVAPKPHVWKGMPVTELLNNTCNFSSPKQTADAIFQVVKEREGSGMPYYLFRIVWVPPSAVIDSLKVLREEHPGLTFDVLDPYSFFASLKKACE